MYSTAESQMLPANPANANTLFASPIHNDRGTTSPKTLNSVFTERQPRKGSETCSARSYRPIAAEPIAIHEPVAFAQNSHAEAAAFKPLVRQVASLARKASFVSLARGTGVFEDSWLSGASGERTVV
jgi:hypothetical protein